MRVLNSLPQLSDERALNLGLPDFKTQPLFNYSTIKYGAVVNELPSMEGLKQEHDRFIAEFFVE